jgi:hypothetical protein
MTDSIEMRMKVFVAGEASSDPNEWSSLTVDRRLVLAGSAEEASDLIEGRDVIEVQIDSAVVLN